MSVSSHTSPVSGIFTPVTGLDSASSSTSDPVQKKYCQSSTTSFEVLTLPLKVKINEFLVGGAYAMGDTQNYKAITYNIDQMIKNSGLTIEQSELTQIAAECNLSQEVCITLLTKIDRESNLNHKSYIDLLRKETLAYALNTNEWITIRTDLSNLKQQLLVLVTQIQKALEPNDRNIPILENALVILKDWLITLDDMQGIIHSTYGAERGLVIASWSNIEMSDYDTHGRSYNFKMSDSKCLMIRLVTAYLPGSGHQMNQISIVYDASTLSIPLNGMMIPTLSRDQWQVLERIYSNRRTYSALIRECTKGLIHTTFEYNRIIIIQFKQKKHLILLAIKTKIPV